jgi:hypothetical protein
MSKINSQHATWFIVGFAFLSLFTNIRQNRAWLQPTQPSVSPVAQQAQLEQQQQATQHAAYMARYQKSFACAGVLFAIIIGILIATGAQNISFRIGFVFITCLFPALASGTWGFFSKKRWDWGRFAATVILFYIVFGLIMISGNVQK